jgi:hypothetical protein
LLRERHQEEAKDYVCPYCTGSEKCGGGRRRAGGAKMVAGLVRLSSSKNLCATATTSSKPRVRSQYDV